MTDVDALSWNAIRGTARVDRRTKDLVKRLSPGDIAVIDHVDVDPVAAEGLVASRASAVINAAASFSGRYPNLGPVQIVRAGVVLVDDLGSSLLDIVHDGDEIIIDGGTVIIGDLQVHGVRRTESDLLGLVDHARRNVGEQLELFAANTLEYLRNERHLAIDEPDLPPTRVDFSGRQVLVVVRGIDYREDLQALHRSGYLREVRPVMIGVDGGADAIREFGFEPDIIIGDFDSVGEATLRAGAELIVHAFPGGRAPGAARLDEMGLEYLMFESAGTSEDIAMLLAYELGAELIVAVGTHSSMEDFLDKGRSGMASTFLVRLKVGRILLDAKGVSRLYRPVVKGRDLGLLVLAMLGSFIAVVSVSEPFRLWARSVWLWIRSVFG
jgi:uncharacterized membrane-anchored protein